VGEFGVVLMIGGNIPGQTQVLSIALYDKVENLQYSEAHWLAAGLVLFSLLLLSLIYRLNRGPLHSIPLPATNRQSSADGEQP
jgi:molybdate transport system permease protein